jgi:hypothetical protein
MRSLRSLSYHEEVSDGNTDNETTYPRGIGTALVHVKDTLEHLSLDGFFLHSMGQGDLLGSLQSFLKMKTLSLRIAMMVGFQGVECSLQLWQMLPSSLEKFKIDPSVALGFRAYESERCRDDLSDQVIGVVSRKRTGFPLLSHIAIYAKPDERFAHFYPDYELAQLPGTEAIQESCTANGVVLEWL